MRGVVKPYVPNEALTLYAIRGKNASKTVRRHVGKRRLDELPFRRQRGPSGPVVKHKPSPAQEAFHARNEPTQVVNCRPARAHAA